MSGAYEVGASISHVDLMSQRMYTLGYFWNHFYRDNITSSDTPPFSTNQELELISL